MARNKKNLKEEVKKEAPVEFKVKKKEKVKEIISLDSALKYFLKLFPEMSKAITDKEVMAVFVGKRIPSLRATKEEFFEILKNF